MSEPPDLESLVRRYLDLWQEQWAAMAADPELADALSRWFGLLNQAGGSFLAGMTQVQPKFTQEASEGADQPDARPSAAHSATKTGPASAGAPFGNGAHDVAKLARRLAALDERLAALEAGARGRGGSASPKPRRGRSDRSR